MRVLLLVLLLLLSLLLLLIVQNVRLTCHCGCCNLAFAGVATVVNAWLPCCFAGCGKMITAVVAAASVYS